MAGKSGWTKSQRRKIAEQESRIRIAIKWGGVISGEREKLSRMKSRFVIANQERRRKKLQQFVETIRGEA